MSPADEAPTELLVRHAHRSGRPVAILRALETGDSCVVETEVYPQRGDESAPARQARYVFSDAHAATAFVVEAVEALMYLGCEVQG